MDDKSIRHNFIASHLSAFRTEQNRTEQNRTEQENIYNLIKVTTPILYIYIYILMVFIKKLSDKHWISDST